MAMETLARQLQARANKTFGQGASDEEIEYAQHELQVVFPADFRDFLSKFGWGGIDYWELYGLGADVPIHLNLIRVTSIERNYASPRLPTALIPIYNDGGGNLYCLNTEKLCNGNNPMVFWDHDLDERQHPEKVEDSFEAWLLTMIN